MTTLTSNTTTASDAPRDAKPPPPSRGPTKRTRKQRATAPTKEAIAARLRQLKDELVVRNHLASLEVKDAVRELANEVERVAQLFTHKVEQSVAMLPSETRLRVHLAMLEGRRRFLEMEQALQTALAGAARSATVVAETARLKAALARMDAEAAAEARRHELKIELRRLEAKSDAVLRDIERRLTLLGIETKKLVTGGE